MSPKGKPDAFYRRAKNEGFAARSVYKLQEIDQKYRLFSPGQCVLDLGAAPGSWLQYLAERVGPEGSVLGIDQKPLRIEAPPNARFLRADVLTCSVHQLREFAKVYHVVVSDMAPATSGNRTGDHVRSVELCEVALRLATELLRLNGHFVCKMLQGEESKQFLLKLKKLFHISKTQKPQASRSESREVFFVATGFLGRGMGHDLVA